MSYEFDNLDMKMRSLCSFEQMHAVSKIAHSRGGIAWWKVGEGKTRIGLFTFALLQNVYQWSLPSICLVVCRRRAFHDWRTEINLCFPGSQVWEDECPVYPPSDSPVFLLVSHAELVKRLARLQNTPCIRFVILDESWMYANDKSARSKAAYSLTSSRKAIGLSGTIMKANDTIEIFNQMKVVHKHRYLAGSPTQFRSKYQICKPVEFVEGVQTPQFYPKKGSYQQIMHALKDVCDVHYPTNKDRKIHEQFHTIPATKKQLKYFRELREFYSLDDFDLEYDNALAISIKTQQVANGWVKDERGDFHLIDSLKPDKLEDEVTDIAASGERVVVWCAFRYDVEMLAHRLKIATMQMVGGEDFDVDRWRHGDIRVCLATEASGVSVNHFDQTPYAIYYSANFKWLDMQQSRGRTDRKSSTHLDCFYKYLQVEDSLDHHVYSTALASGASEQKLIFSSGVKEWLRGDKVKLNPAIFDAVPKFRR